MKTSLAPGISVLIGISILISCEIINDSKRDYEVPEFDLDQSEYTDNELLNATYSDYKFPDNFYSENLGDTNLYYVNTVSIDSLDEGKWIELSTNSFDQAKGWSIRSTYENSQFEPGKVCEKYFEFIRTYNPVDNNLIKFRTHRASYLTRDNFDHFNKSDTIGVFKKQNFTDIEAKELIDYLWFTDNYNNASSKILSSYFENNQKTINVYHYELFIVYGDFGLHDKISLLKKIYKIDRNSGLIIVDKVLIRVINGEMN